MSIVAITHESIACDSQLNSAITEPTVDELNKKFKVIKDGKYIIAAVGHANLEEHVHWWISSVDDKKNGVDRHRGKEWTDILANDVCFVYNTHDQVLKFYYPEDPWGTVMSLPFAIGSGRELAIGAMYAGASAKRACKIASKFDPNCGGLIHEHIFS